VVEHRSRQVKAAVCHVDAALSEVRDERPVPAAVVVQAEASGFAVGDAKQLIEAKLLRFL
jgi:hypothetical protein